MCSFSVVRIRHGKLSKPVFSVTRNCCGEGSWWYFWVSTDLQCFCSPGYPVKPIQQVFGDLDICAQKCDQTAGWQKDPSTDQSGHKAFLPSFPASLPAVPDTSCLQPANRRALALGATCAITYLDFLAGVLSNGSNRLKEVQQTSSLSQCSKGQSVISISMPNLHLQNADPLVHPGCNEVQ